MASNIWHAGLICVSPASWPDCGKVRSSWMRSGGGIGSSVKHCDITCMAGSSNHPFDSTPPETQSPVVPSRVTQRTAQPTAGFRINDRRLVRIIKGCRDLPGYELFQYLDQEGNRQTIDSADVNDYLREISGEEITAKDFRTWAGTNLAVLALQEFELFDTEAKRKRAVEKVAKHLGNTPAICRRCYI